MKSNKETQPEKPLNPISAKESYDFLIKNKAKFISEFGKEKYDQAIAEYETHLGNRKKSARGNDLESL
jgi:hypothetical protein